MKKLILLIALVLALTIPAFAASPSLTLSGSETGAVGGQITVDVQLSGSPGICGCALAISYDSDCLAPVSYTGGKGFSGLRSGNLAAKNASGDEIVSYTLVSAGKIKADGTVASFTFDVLKAPEGGSVYIGIEKFTNNPFLMDSSGSTILTSVSGTSVAISGGTPQSDDALVIDPTPEPSASPDQPSEVQPETPEFVLEDNADSPEFVIDDYETGAATMPTATELEAYEAERQKTEEAQTAQIEEIRLELKQSGGYISGYPDGTFRPDATITRAETAVIFDRLSSFNGGFEQVFSDVTASQWYAAAVCRAFSGGIISGYTDGTFKPDMTITRAEFCAVLARKMGYNGDSADFSDTVGHWASAYITACREAKITSGYSDGSFKPDAPISRAEAVTMINRALSVTAENTENPFNDLTDSHWAYGDILAAVGTTARG